MKKALFILSILALSLLGCRRNISSRPDTIPLVKSLASDTTGLFHAAGPAGWIVILGAPSDVVETSRLFAAEDAEDNIDARPVPDQLPDFSGERFIAVIDSLFRPDSTARERVVVQAWSAARIAPGIAPKLYVWHYIANFHNYMVPYPDYLHFADDIRLFVKNHAVGLFEQGDSGCTVGDFVAARAWIISHLLWNPQLDEKNLTNEFFTGYYGAAADALLRYWQLTVDAVVKAGVHLHVGGDIPPGWMTDDVLRDCMKLFDEAEAAVSNQPECLSRVRKARLGIDLCAIKRHIASIRLVRFQNAKPEDVFLLPDAEKRKQLKIEAPSDTPELCADLPSGKWDSFQENRFRLIRPGEWVDVVDDPAASNGKAVAMPGDSPQWAVQVPMGGYPNNLPWVVYYSVRCDADAKDGTAFTCGLHNNGTGGDHFITHHAVSECSGKTYKLFKSNPVSIPEDGYLWFCPPARPKSQVGKIYIDHVFIIQENMPQQH